jgi:DNA replicative helicase MCM subunit Mcm2 (Cdc46/Mcm family)
MGFYYPYDAAIKVLSHSKADWNVKLFRFKVEPELDMSNSIQLPAMCPSVKTKPCTGVKFVPVEGSAVCHDYQEIKIQESMQTLGVGSVPRSIVVVLEDDLVDSTKAGGKLNSPTCFFPEVTLCEINE